jgi:hypothetical protein
VEVALISPSPTSYHFASFDSADLYYLTLPFQILLISIFIKGTVS